MTIETQSRLTNLAMNRRATCWGPAVLVSASIAFAMVGVGQLVEARGSGDRSSAPTSNPGSAALPDPCTLLTDSEIQAATGRKVVSHGPGEVPTAQKSCRWVLGSAPGDIKGFPMTVELGISIPPEGARQWLENQKAAVAGFVRHRDANQQAVIARMPAGGDVSGIGDGAYELPVVKQLIAYVRNIGISVDASSDKPHAQEDLAKRAISRL